MQFNPVVGVWVGAISTISSAIVAMGAGFFPSYVPHDIAVDILGTLASINVVLTAANTALHLYSSSMPGPLAPPDPPAK